MGDPKGRPYVRRLSAFSSRRIGRQAGAQLAMTDTAAAALMG